MLKSKIDVNYNNNIDFLRAISVLAVLVYHLEIFLFDKQILRGGFLGVDVFFLILKGEVSVRLLGGLLFAFAYRRSFC